MEWFGLILCLVAGAMMGSFACCQVWRMRYREVGKGGLGKWSVCLGCGARLKWYDNIPVVSWVILRGKCRKCGKKIGVMEILSEVGMTAVYGLIYWYFWMGTEGGLAAGDGRVVAEMVTMMILMVGMWMLLLYDARWGEMPTVVLYFCIGMAGVYRAFAGVGNWWSLLGAVVILAGLYLLLYIASREKLMGAGDWLLCLAIALVLGDWWLALVELFMANLLGSVVMAPVAMRTKKHKIHFAPFLILGFLIVFLLQDMILELIVMGG